MPLSNEELDELINLFEKQVNGPGRKNMQGTAQFFIANIETLPNNFIEKIIYGKRLKRIEDSIHAAHGSYESLVKDRNEVILKLLKRLKEYQIK